MQPEGQDVSPGDDDAGVEVVPGEDDPRDRRIRRLEEQLLFFQELAFAALEYGHRQAVDAAAQRGGTSPATADVREAVMALMRDRRSEWAAKWKTASDGDEDPT